jgi:hypothetical protein
MFSQYKNTPVPRVPGLKGSDLARAENLNQMVPFKAIGEQPLFGSGSGDGGGGGTTGGFNVGSNVGEQTGAACGGSGNLANCMTTSCMNPYYQGPHSASDKGDPFRYKDSGYPPFQPYYNGGYPTFDPYYNTGTGSVPFGPTDEAGPVPYNSTPCGGAS